MPAAAPLVLGLAGAGAVGGSIFQGQQQKQAARRSIRAQERAQDEATSRAAAEVRRQSLAERRLNRRKPDITSLLSAERRSGLGETSLTGAGGVGRGSLTLGRSSLLGSA